ncbi:1-acyl-sn-glycerol-3-phosphate acyltransferase [Brevibacillus agri]|uniref:1-acyl-sn-glycerol-3-phosphate acyltransferase n=1 Tax=Brevibacillus agri TaxID=51101 RepID=A0A3M8AQ86_9BACL|nr:MULTISPECIES: lysophospholipid acyltransferase family protein [Brevibacillus]EJL40946.1 1-acyl-sn-glycerol-3-phosphate acyltransferase [Brevibacillus sp. CF112]MBY0050424.1 1-acyl-sn-glycerol-3-phosphate acyltransferase [Brevibacillus agri]MCG5249989.1 1-acyl-sn-glycerol-3-phosphate acyltransferase [Brevibacillus agri]MDN4091439.1 lysophospholipid acyltransferase family protein [Brevibacillus agri]MDR9502995.1 lysophospholipid acyltransferase family protein [Brevibacillus agri]
MTYYRLFRGIFRIIFSLVFRWQVIGREHIPKEGPVILCANHISLWDPPLLGSGIERQVHFMAKEELFKIPLLSFLITKFGAFPVKRGAGDRAAIRTTLKLLEDGKIFGIFPEGTRSKTGEPGEAMPGVAMFALKSQAAVIPVAIIGPYRAFRPIKIVYGKPIDLTSLREAKSGSDVLKETSDLIMARIKELRDQHLP